MERNHKKDRILLKVSGLHVVEKQLSQENPGEFSPGFSLFLNC
ncbi:hypothetical protein QY96_00289 [Bacillus thermotolerans]|nr:hypothetical protein QY96_00289 [Bacillus thermotolerans]